MKALKKIGLIIDSVMENLAQVALLVMILIVTVQVLTRKLLGFVIHGSEEVTMVLLIWFSFMGIAVGFREHLHLAIDSFTVKFSKRTNKAIDKLVNLGCIAFGIYMIKYGWDFVVLMSGSTLAATKMPNSVFYAATPLAGVFICIYNVLQLVGIDTKRHQGADGGGH